MEKNHKFHKPESIRERVENRPCGEIGTTGKHMCGRFHLGKKDAKYEIHFKGS